VIDAANPPAVPPRQRQRPTPMTQRLMRNAYYLPFSRRLDIEYPSGVRHVIINCFTPDRRRSHPARASGCSGTTARRTARRSC
jgi:hypothetical protein